MTDSQAAEIARLRARVAELSRPRRRWRSVLVAVLMVLVFVLTPLAVVASWSSAFIGDTDRFVATMGPLAADSDVQAAVSARAASAVTDRLDVNSLLQQVAPADRPRLETALGRLKGPINSAVHSFVQKQTAAVVASSWFQTFWRDANRRAHAALDKALTGSGGGAVQLANNQVVIDVGPVIDQVKQRLVSSGMTIADKIPTPHTQIAVADGKSLEKARTYNRILQILGTWLAVIVLVLAAVAVWLSRRRRRTAVTAAILIAAGALLLGLGLLIGRSLYLDKLPAGVSSAAAGAVYDQLVHFLRTAVRTVAVLFAAVALGTWISGPGRRAGQARGLWSSGIDATRAAAGNMGMKLGPVGGFVHRFKRWLMWIVPAGGALVLVLWPYPTGWVVVGIVLVVLFLLTVVEFLDDRPRPAARADGATPAPDAAS
ncbi:hypothetical protein BIV57_01165 [Mangrovactinospora gilvigrisea]|uniref:Integral membrane protein n=1 Tax=Mangrovactinospora gilvigrisea TaxID=1428644 RepID=A0A1J7C164_9ACTN|nr:hypothetical protein [Mangrovactinospora gilvigrisea]OIV39473.1 hypothetical protein BIV57_01165 [Mangrovactinospora gilvigrisea]